MSLYVYRTYSVFSSLFGWSALLRWGYVFAMLCLMTTIVGIVFGVLCSPRTWCSFCSMGTLEKGLYSLGEKKDEKVTLDYDECVKCGLCSRVCPMQLSPFVEADNEHFQVMNKDCIKCGICVDNCPLEALCFKPAKTTKQVRTKRKVHKAKVKKVKKLTDNIIELTFETDSEIAFSPGQFILLRVDMQKKLFRAYSIVSAQGNELTIAVKHVKDGLASDFLFSLKKGDNVHLEGPAGRFTLGKNDSLLFIGVGIDITPFVSLVKQALSEGKKVTLLHGARYKKDLIYEEYFRGMGEKNFTYLPTLTCHAGEKECGIGRITKHLRELEIDKKTQVYLCGMRDMVDDAKKILDQKGITSIYSESF